MAFLSARCAFLVIAVVTYALAVDRHNFKSCDQSGFCKRLRGMEKGVSPYIAHLETVRINQTRVSFVVENTRNKVRFLVELVQLIDNTLRIRMRESKPLRRRFEFPIGDVLVGEPIEDQFAVEKNDGEKLVLISASNPSFKYVISSKPLRVDIFNDSDLLLSLNARGLLQFEHTRTKPSGFSSWFSSADDDGSSPRGNIVSRFGRFMKSWLVEPLAFAFGGHQADAEADVDDSNEKEDVASREAESETWNERGEKVGADGSRIDEAAADGDENKFVHDDEHADTTLTESEDEITGIDVGEEEFKGHRDRKPYGPQAIGLDFTFFNFRHVYGIPEHADSLTLRFTKNGSPYRLYNLDVFEYELHNKMALYASIPFMLAHSASRSVGLFWLNPSETWVDVEPIEATSALKPQVDTHWMSETGNLDVFLLLGPRPADLFRQYGRLTGTTPLPPIAAIGYHQSRWNYNDEQDCLDVDAKFDEAEIPYDVLWLDIEHTDGKRYFTWDKQKFPDPHRLVTALASKGRRLTTIIDPHIKLDSSFSVYTEARDQDLLVKTYDGNAFEGWCWPGTSVYLDFINPATRAWWASRFAPQLYEGSSAELFTWNDMNEPSVFNGPEVTMAKDNLHFLDREHREVHNAYGFYVHMASFEGHLRRSNGSERPFVLTRSAFAGSQRFSAIWTGDNTADWGHLKMSVPMILSLNLVGMTFSGADIGGFFRNPDPELLARWYQAAAFTPFFRAHAHIETIRREPYLQPERYEKVIREAIRMRVALVPYWYTLFWLSERSGAPLVAPLWVHFPTDTTTFSLDQQFMVGPALLVQPVLERATEVISVYLPQTVDDLWYDVVTHKEYAGGKTYEVSVNLHTIPVYQRGGTIVPRRERIRRAVTLAKNDPFTLYIALDKKGSAAGELYVDDYHTYRYRTHNEFAHVAFTFQDGRLEARRASNQSKFGTDAWIERVVIMGAQRSPRGVILSVSHKGHKSVPTGPSSLDFTYDADSRTVVIRRPGVNVRDLWQMILS